MGRVNLESICMHNYAISWVLFLGEARLFWCASDEIEGVSWKGTIVLMSLPLKNIQHQ